MDLQTGAPHFYTFIKEITAGDENKFIGILAMSYLIMIKYTKWHYFFEITGEGGTGKSTLSEIIQLLVGKDNVAVGDLKELEKKSSTRTCLIGRTLLLLPDQNKYISEGGLLKKISSQDIIDIDPKYKEAISYRADMSILAVNNHRMIFKDHDSGIERRHIRIMFNEIIEAPDIGLLDKIKVELPFIVNHLLALFKDINNAHTAVKALTVCEDMEALRREDDPLYDFFCCLDIIDEPTGLFIGNKTNNQNLIKPEKYLYHAYEIMYSRIYGKPPAISTIAFTRQLKSFAHSKKKVIKRSKKKEEGKYRTNLVYKSDADLDFLLPENHPIRN